MRDVFISYGGPDEAFASRLCDRLRSAGVDAFFFPDSAEYGPRLHNVMRDGINNARCAVLICSKDSLNRSGVANEVEESLSREAEEGGRPFLIPIALDDFVFADWQPPNPGLARAVRQRVIGDFREARRDGEAFERNLDRLLRAIRQRSGAGEAGTTEIHNFDPATGMPDERFGVSEWPRSKGRISFVKWRDPGGPGYHPAYPYDRPNRALAVYRLRDGKRQWREYNLTKVQDGRDVWEGPSHHWVEAEHDFAAIGDHRPGLVLFRKDIGGFKAEEGRVRILEFFIPNDAASIIKTGCGPRIYMRWTSDEVGTTLEKREVPIDVVGFAETEFVITDLVVDP